MKTENLSTLKIHKLTKEQYDRELAAGRIDENAIYLTPDETIDLSEYATVEQLNGKADTDHGHAINDVTGLQVQLDGKAESGHNHSEATESQSGFMSAADKTKLNNTYGANQINYINACSRDTIAEDIRETGILCNIDEIEVEMNDGDIVSYCSGIYEIPIVAGDNINIKINDRQVAEISTNKIRSIVEKGTVSGLGFDNDDGIYYDIDDVEHAYDDGQSKIISKSVELPIIAGKNIEFTFNEAGDKVKINAKDAIELIHLGQEVSCVEILDGGISYDVEDTTIVYEGGEEKTIGSSAFLPIVAGNGIEIAVNDSGMGAEININDEEVAVKDDIDALQLALDEIKDAKADWNQNDSSAVDYIKNRTHWTSEGMKVVVPSTTETNIRKVKTATSYGSTAESEPEYNYNKTYLVTVDGVQYRCTPYQTSDNWGSTFFSLGDSRLFEKFNENDELVPDNSHPENVPFLVQAWVEDDGGSGLTFYHYWSIYYPPYESHTIEISELTGELEYHKLDLGFIPDEVAVKTEIPIKAGEGTNSATIGEDNTNKGVNSLVVGYKNTINADCGVRAIVAGYNNTMTRGVNGTMVNPSGVSSLLTGTSNSVIEGGGCHSLMGGSNNTVSGNYVIVGGSGHTVSGDYAFATGNRNVAKKYQTVLGKFCTDSSGATYDNDTSGDIFKIGNGTSDSARSNAVRVTTAGKVYGTGTFGTSGADYAEYFEWLDGNPDNEDRRGHFVALEGGKIRYATVNDDYILGVVSTSPSVAGDIHSEDWHNKYLKDVFGSKIVNVIEVEETTNENGEIIPAHTERRWVLNPDYDPNAKYVSREERPEWAAIGIVGKLVVVDDGTCQVNGYCHPGAGGIATSSQEKTNYRVMERLDDAHIRIFVR